LLHAFKRRSNGRSLASGLRFLVIL